MSLKSVGKNLRKKPRKIGYVRSPEGVEGLESFFPTAYMKKIGKLDIIFWDKTTSEPGDDQDVVEYTKMMKTIRRGDILVVPHVNNFMLSSFDNITDSIFELAENIYGLHTRGIHLVDLHNSIDTSSDKNDGLFRLCDVLMGLLEY